MHGSTSFPSDIWPYLSGNAQCPTRISKFVYVLLELYESIGLDQGFSLLLLFPVVHIALNKISPSAK